MDVYEATKTVLAVRQFQDRSIPAETVRRILESAWLTASSQNGQPWHFIATQDKATINKLASLNRTGPYIAQAPLVVAVGMDKSIYAVSDASRAIQSMILTAWSEGVGSNWTGFNNLKQINPVLGIPEDIDILALVAFGYPLKKIGMGKKNRKPFGDVVNRERFGQPFEEEPIMENN